MAATKRNAMLVEGTRERIQTTQLALRLQDHGLGKLKKPLDATQIRAIEVLLRKTLPDLQAVEHSGPAGAPIQFIMSGRPPKEK